MMALLRRARSAVRFAFRLARRFLPRILQALLFNPVALTLGTVTVVVVLLVVGNPVLDDIELNWLDLRFHVRGPIAPTSAVVIAAIDEKSLSDEGRWPWPRARFAALIDKLSQDGARVIGFDVTFAEPDENSSLAMVDEIAGRLDALPAPDPGLVEFIRRSRIDADNDRRMADALKRSSAPVVLGYFFHMTEGSVGYRLDQDDIDTRLARIARSKYPVVIYNDAGRDRLRFIRAYAPQNNLDMFTGAAASSGYISVQIDPDGVVRWMPLMLQGGEDLYPPLSLMCVWQYLGRPPLAVRTGPDGVTGVQMGTRFVPTDASGRMLINYRGPAMTFPHYSISDILEGRLPRGTFKDKIVVVGATATGIGDLRSTPFAPVYPGSEIHANVIDDMLAGDYITKPHWSKAVDALAIIVLGTLVGVALPRMSALRALLFTCTLFVAYVGTAYWVFVKAHIWLNMVYPVFALAATYTMLTLYRYITEERERKRIKDTFRHYVAPDVIEAVLKDPVHLRIGGQERILTVLFSDLAGFTAVSEQHSPKQVINILSEYHERMTEQLFAHQGTLVGYVGDELIGLFGAPVEQADQAQRACAAALAMLEQRKALGDRAVALGRPRLRARTGINTGTMLVGNIGSRYRFAYSVLGDQVNLASRLENINKVYGTEIILGEETARQVAGSFALRRLDLVRVVGRHQALAIFELLGTSAAALPLQQEKMLGLYAAALDAYLQRRWDEAMPIFGECLALCPDDVPSRVMGNRCRGLRATPPPENWDGAFEHVTKY